MRFVETGLAGAYVIEIEPEHDGRGFFARCSSRRDFEAQGLLADLPETSISCNSRKGTLRGLHYQVEPFAEAKLVRCVAGAVYDVIVDLREGSATRLRWYAVELTAENRRALYVPKGFAHGFQSLVDGSDVFYQISAPYSPEHAAGIRWDDPRVGITWPPATQRTISARDRAFPLLG